MRAVDVVRKVAPHAQQNYMDAFENGDALLKQAGITTPLRLAHFLAQTLEETGGYVIFIESGNYSAARVCEVWPSRFPTLNSAQPFAHNAEALFNNVYANRMGNGPSSSGDGYRFRGRGILQTTGREAYRKYGKRCGADFENNPDLIFAAEHALKPALAEWTDSGCNSLADQDNIREITRRVNGGYTNLSERERWLGVVKAHITSVEFKLDPAHPAVLPPPPAPVPVPPKPSSTARTGGAVVAGSGGAAAAHQAGLSVGWIIAIAIGCAILGAIIGHILTKPGASK